MLLIENAGEELGAGIMVSNGPLAWAVAMENRLNTSQGSMVMMIVGSLARSGSGSIDRLDIQIDNFLPRPPFAASKLLKAC